jgi:hypothetical protein
LIDSFSPRNFAQTNATRFHFPNATRFHFPFAKL